MWSQPETTVKKEEQQEQGSETSAASASSSSPVVAAETVRKAKVDVDRNAILAEPIHKKQRAEGPSEETKTSCNAVDESAQGFCGGGGSLQSPEMSREASLRTMQLIRLQRAISSDNTSVTNMGVNNNDGLNGGASSSSSTHSTNSPHGADRQRIFASLVQAAAAVPEPSFFPAQGQQAQQAQAPHHGAMSSFSSHQSLGHMSCHSRNYGDMAAGSHNNGKMIGWNTNNNITNNDTSPDVTQYLQFQAFKRFQQQQQQRQRNQFMGTSSSSNDNMANMNNFPRPGSDFSFSNGSNHSQGGMMNNNAVMNYGQQLPQGFPGRSRIVSDDGMAYASSNASSFGSSSSHMMFRNPNNGMNAMNMSVTAANMAMPMPPLSLPILLARPEDALKVSSHQVLLRHQIEAFQATEDDVSTHTRGRNKPIKLGQVGIRCRHCAHLPVLHRQKGSTYFPASTLGLYQAAQNMSTTHIQCGLCHCMPNVIKAQFADLLSSKVSSSGAGRPYWAESAKKLGLVNTEDGIFFVRDVPPNVRLVSDAELTKPKPPSASSAAAKKAALAQAKSQA